MPPLRIFVLTCIAVAACSELALISAQDQPRSPASSPPQTSPLKWESSIQAFEKKIASGQSKPGGVLFIGSSSIRMWNLAEWFPGHQTINHGFGGSEVSDSLHFFDRIVTPVKPSLILIYAGDNDLAKGKTAEIVHRDFNRFAKRVKSRLPPNTKVAFIAIKPSIKRWNLRDEISRANALIAKDCATNKQLEYVDIWTPMLGENGEPNPELFAKDGLHMNDSGYRIWTDVVMKLMPAPRPAQ